MAWFGKAARARRRARKTKRRARRAERRRQGKGIRGAFKRFGNWIGENKGKILKGAAVLGGTLLGGGILAGGAALVKGGLFKAAGKFSLKGLGKKLIGKVGKKGLGGFAKRAFGKLKGKGLIKKMVLKAAQNGGKLLIPKIKETLARQGFALPETEQEDFVGAIAGEYQKATGQAPELDNAQFNHQVAQDAAPVEVKEDYKKDSFMEKIKKHWKVIASAVVGIVVIVLGFKFAGKKGGRRRF